MNNLAGTLAVLGYYKKAEDLYRGCLKRRSAILGRQHPDTLCTMHDLAQFLGKHKRDHT
eukprot:CAMPEP_0117074254 /NCGR_PEP_ID=MMETSP0472-20121206/52310_1 /TAXON_ID=693140 ORGANISM="Tiarina fusus, Strain LIS" /NCGR_SAMPLE_ID=MMETSP0472 /ASSEMBLY_ACC=CAM_ASM_000603 /LENGTH=58 /DNA_ID=CAMNT_0004799191 /DNA_START=64 /DNA_END=236 /DNA_ORIENTATION=+